MDTSKRSYYPILVLILLTGFFLRFWNYWNIPFMFDELSAMSRTTYDSFSDLIRFGVVERDSHPAGIQAFLYYWVKLFGDSEPIVKLPFLLAGLASIWLSFKVGELWFGKTTGILTAAFVSSLQLFVMYSQIARPYVSGLFFTLAMVFFWSKYFFVRPRIKYLLGFVLFASLAAYNHYFSLLFAATVGISGLFFVNRKTVLPYIFSGIAIVVLYLPHLEIIFSQAEKGSIGGWLGEPGPYFLLHFIYWLFHKSIVVPGLVLAIIIIGVITRNEKHKTSDLTKRKIILLLWLLPAPLFGYIYSYTVEPILQFSLLIFTTPYFLMLIFSFVGEMEIKKMSIAIVIILAVNSLTLIFTRDYYKVFYKQPFKNVVEQALHLEEQFPNNVFILNHYIPYFTEYYLKHSQNPGLPFFTTRNANLSLMQFDSVVSSIKENIVITSGLHENAFQIIKHHFPYWIGYDHGFTFEQYTFSKIETDNCLSLTPKLITQTDFAQPTGDWKTSHDFIVYDSISKNTLYHMSPENEWGPVCEFSLDSISHSGYIIFDIELEVKSQESQNKAVIVTEIFKGDERLVWRGFDFKEFELNKGEWHKIFATLDIQNALNNKMNIDNCQLRVYVWNPQKNDFLINEIRIMMRPGNPIRFAL